VRIHEEGGPDDAGRLKAAVMDVTEVITEAIAGRSEERPGRY